MNKICAVISCALFIAVSSCTDTPKGNANATWYIGTVNYDATNIQRVTTGTPQLMATTSDGNNSVQVFFKTLPSAPGNFNIVNESKAATNTLATNEVAIEMNVCANGAYTSIGNDNQVALVYFNSNNNMKVAFPTFKLLNETSLDTISGGNGAISEY